MKVCSICGGQVERDKHPVTVPVPYEGEDQKITVRGFECERCADCGEMFLAPGESSSLLKAARDQLRRQEGLLTSEEIREISKRLRESYPKIEKVLGFGKNTIAPLATGDRIQSQSKDRLLRLISDPVIYRRAKKILKRVTSEKYQQ